MVLEISLFATLVLPECVLGLVAIVIVAHKLLILIIPLLLIMKVLLLGLAGVDSELVVVVVVWLGEDVVLAHCLWFVIRNSLLANLFVIHFAFYFRYAMNYLPKLSNQLLRVALLTLFTSRVSIIHRMDSQLQDILGGLLLHHRVQVAAQLQLSLFVVEGVIEQGVRVLVEIGGVDL